MGRQLSKSPPFNKEAEAAVIGSILLNNGALMVSEAIIEPEDFYLEIHRMVYRAMIEMADEKIPIDHVTLGNKLIKGGNLKKIGGPMALDQFANSVVVASNVEHYAGIVREKAAIRHVIYAAQQVVANGFDDRDTDNLEEDISRVVAASERLARTRMPDSIFKLGEGVLDIYKRVAAGYRGIQLAWPTLDKMTAGMWPKTVTMFVARPGTGKCLEAKTLVYVPTIGQYKTIEQIVKDKSDILTRSPDGSIGPITPSAWLDMGEKECLRIGLYSGRDMSQTPEHPMMTVDGWKRTDELEVGDYVEAAGIVPEPIESISVDDNESMLIGAMLADGGVSSLTPSFTKSDGVIIDIVRRMLGFYGCGLSGQNGPKARKNDPRHAITNRSCFWKHWDGWGCVRGLSKNKMIPDRVFQYDNKSLSKFLGMFWSCDGSFPVSKKGQVTAEVGLASRAMVEQLQRLFLRFGIHGSVRYKPVKLKGKIFDSWVYKIYATSHSLFRENIPIIGKKAEKVKLLSDSVNPNIDNIPITPALKKELIGIVDRFTDEERVFRYEKMSTILGMSSRISVNKIYRRSTVSRRVFSAFVEAFDAGNLRHLLVNHWDRVESIKEDGVRRVYDLTVDDTHSFVANDMVVHNTFVAVIEARHAWLQGNRVLIVSPEMSKEEIAERFFVLSAGVSYQDVIHGQLSELAYPAFERTIEELKVAENLWIMDSDDDLSPAGIDAAIRACKPQLVATDSIYDLHIKGDRRDRAIGALEWQKKSSKRYEYAACGFAQQNRAAEVSEKKGGGSRLGTIALADEIGQDVHAVFALEQTRDDRDDKKLHFRVLKLRRGTRIKSVVTADWDFDKMQYDEVPDEEEEYNDVEGDVVPF